MSGKIQKYRPSNGTEGAWFHGEFCFKCRKHSEEKPCQILGKTFIYDVEDKEYPRQWQRHEDGGVLCTAFVDKLVKVAKKPVRDDITIDMFGGAK